VVKAPRVEKRKAPQCNRPPFEVITPAGELIPVKSNAQVSPPRKHPCEAAAPITNCAGIAADHAGKDRAEMISGFGMLLGTALGNPADRLYNPSFWAELPFDGAPSIKARSTLSNDFRCQDEELRSRTFSCDAALPRLPFWEAASWN